MYIKENKKELKEKLKELKGAYKEISPDEYLEFYIYWIDKLLKEKDENKYKEIWEHAMWMQQAFCHNANTHNPNCDKQLINIVSLIDQIFKMVKGNCDYSNL